MISKDISELDLYLDVDEIFTPDPHGLSDLPLHDKLSRRRQVEDLMEKRRLREELADF